MLSDVKEDEEEEEEKFVFLVVAVVAAVVVAVAVEFFVSIVVVVVKEESMPFCFCTELRLFSGVDGRLGSPCCLVFSMLSRCSFVKVASRRWLRWFFRWSVGWFGWGSWSLWRWRRFWLRSRATSVGGGEEEEEDDDEDEEEEKECLRRKAHAWQGSLSLERRSEWGRKEGMREIKECKWIER